MAVAASSVPNAMAVGPSSSGLKASPAASSAAIRMRRFFTTRYVTSCLRSARRISASSLTLRPRYSETMRCGCARSPRAARPPSPAWPLSACCPPGRAGAGVDLRLRPCPRDGRPEARLTAGARPPGGAMIRSCLGVLAGVPGALRSALGPVRRIKPRPSRGCWSAGAGCLRRSVGRLAAAVRPDAALSAAGIRRRWPGRPASARHRAGQAAARSRQDAGTSTRMPGPIVARRSCPEVLALRAGRPGAVDRVDQRGEVRRRAGRARSWPCRRDVDDAALVDLELDAAALDLADRRARGRT